MGIYNYYDNSPEVRDWNERERLRDREHYYGDRTPSTRAVSFKSRGNLPPLGTRIRQHLTENLDPRRHSPSELVTNAGDAFASALVFALTGGERASTDQQMIRIVLGACGALALAPAIHNANTIDSTYAEHYGGAAVVEASSSTAFIEEPFHLWVE